ncbi:unnamed protein product [Clavelina lepadiformis]|uniref:DEP domain-containing protein n=1 Tax=Clavelina lepadiformis TaxID=159417 RepID=A0ABP0F6J3_CLALP
MMSATSQKGPYRATKLWNDVVHLFQVGMPTKKHRHLLKTYVDCFIASDAVEWLHALLKANENFGPNVTKQQTVQLLKKFLKNHVIEDVFGKWGDESFSDNSQLYRFPVMTSPRSFSRKPLSSLDGNVLKLGNCGNNFTAKLSQKVSAPSKKTSLAKTTIERIWQAAFLDSLKRALHLQDSSCILPSVEISLGNLIQNSTDVDLSCIGFNQSVGDMPCWLLSAMKCLSTWPDGDDSGLPCYEGFEKDVFQAILEYFQTHPAPLLTFQLFELFTTMLTRCELLDEMCRGHTHSFADKVSSAYLKQDLELKRIEKNLMQAQMRHENIARHHSTRAKYCKRQLSNEDGFVDVEDNDIADDPRQVYKLEERATRHAWENRFQSVRELDVLNEETSFSSAKKPDLNADSNACSLPELRPWANDQKFPISSNTDYINLAFQKDLDNQQVSKSISTNDVDIHRSVEDLLLNMSLSSRNELEMDLMTSVVDDGDQKCEEEPPICDRLSNSFHEILQESPIVEPKFTEQIKLSSGQTSSVVQSHNWHFNQKTVACNAVSDNTLKNTHRHSSTTTNCHQGGCKNAGYECDVEPVRDMHQRKHIYRARSLRPPVVATSYPSCGNVSRSKSCIVARVEVPPVSQTKNDVNCNRVKSRIIRLPYVSASTSNYRVGGPRAHYLSRSHSSLGNKRIFHESLSTKQQMNPPCHHKSVKSLNKFEPSFTAPSNEPQSPLTAALDVARRKLVIEDNAMECPHSCEGFQLCLLLIPAENRRRLHLLLHLMSKMATNPRLIAFDKNKSTRNLLIDKFATCIIRASNEDKIASQCLSERVTRFLLDHASVVMMPPEKLRKEVEKRKQQALNEKDKVISTCDEPEHLLKRQYTFCKQVSNEEYDNHCGVTLNNALTGLLHDIVKNENLSEKEKKKKLKQFQKLYPDIYREHFASNQMNVETRQSASKKPLLSNALKKLRNLRM